MASCTITSRQIDGETMETVTDFIFLGSKITADGDCSHEIRRHLLLQRKTMISLGSILKSRYITLPTKVPLFKAMVFIVVMNGCERWTIKIAEASLLPFRPPGMGILPPGHTSAFQLPWLCWAQAIMQHITWSGNRPVALPVWDCGGRLTHMTFCALV